MQENNDKTRRDEEVWLPGLVGDDSDLEGYVFINCVIVGPAVLGAEDSIFANNEWGVDANPESMLWEVPYSRQSVIGIIKAIGCTFRNCTFLKVGFAVRPEEAQQIRAMGRLP